MSTDAASRLVSHTSTKEVEPSSGAPRNCDSRRKDVGFDYLGEFKRKRNMSGAHCSNTGSRRFMKAGNNLNGNGGGCDGQSNLSFFQVADCISEEAEQSMDDDNG